MEYKIKGRSSIKIYNGNCMQAMAKMRDNQFELAIVDPPYGLDQKSTHGRGKLKNRMLNKSAKKFLKWDKAPSKKYFTELFRVSKNQVIWGGNYFGLPPTRGIICWDKCQPWENFSQIEYAWTSFDKPAKLFKFDNRTGGKIHPTQKPVALYKWILKNYAKEGDKILDTHLGSGSITIACWDAKFDLMGYELDTEYYENACNRIDNHTRQIQFEF